ncbi:g9010 [Coccomyxa elongata]
MASMGRDRASRQSALLVVALLGAAACVASAEFFEDFRSGWEGRWAYSADDKYTGRFVADTPEGWTEPGLKVPEKAKHYGLTTKLDTPVDPAKGLVLQYELKLTDGLTCGGAYLKFLTETADFDPAELTDGTPYTVMFGPDKCGGTNKVHLILKHKSPKTGELEEKHLKSPPMVETDKKTHLYTVILKPDNTYTLLIDGEEKKSGSILEDFDPAVNPPEEIDDPEDSKPEDWVDTPKIADPEATKPEDWDEDAPRMIEDEEAEKPEGWLDDEPAEVDDPEASQPEDWDEEEDGEWEAPKIANPKCKAAPGCGEWKRPMKSNPNYKGKWTAPLIDNPEYKGVWKPRKIANPDYFLDEAPLANIGKIGGVAVEIWTMDEGYLFDNILVANDASAAQAKREDLWVPKKEAEDAAEAKAEEEAKSKAEAEAGGDEDEEETMAAKLVARVHSAFDLPALAPYRGLAQPLFDLLEHHEATVFLVLAAPGLLILFLLFTLLGLLGGSKKKNTPLGKAKKKDVTGPDDAAVKAKAEVVQEVKKEVPVEDEDEDEAKGPKRRSRRET